MLSEDEKKYLDYLTTSRQCEITFTIAPRLKGGNLKDYSEKYNSDQEVIDKVIETAMQNLEIVKDIFRNPEHPIYFEFEITEDGTICIK